MVYTTISSATKLAYDKDVVTSWLQRLFDVIALKLQSHLKINYYLKREQNF